MKRSLNEIVERAKKADAIVIFGAGERGKELLHQLQNKTLSIKCFFDNNASKIGEYVNGIKIMKPYKLDQGKVLYVLAVDSMKARKELQIQLQSLKIEVDDIISYYYRRDYDYMRHLDERYYQDELQDMYYERFGKKLIGKIQLPITRKLIGRSYTLKMSGE